MTKTMKINYVERVTYDDKVERLEFITGVNLVIGLPNTGKTTWLNMIDYVLGYSDIAEKKLKSDVCNKYCLIRCELEISGEKLLIERRWDVFGKMDRVYVNETAMMVGDEFSNYLLKKLNIPTIHYYVKGTSSDSWKNLSWRLLFPHIYRNIDSWVYIAHNKSRQERFAAIALLLNFAEKIYPQEIGDEVDKQKQLLILDSKRKEVINIIDQITDDLPTNYEVSSFSSNEEIDKLINKLKLKSIDLINEKNSIIEQSLKSQATINVTECPEDIQLSEKRLHLTEKLDQIKKTKINILQRLDDINRLKINLQDELLKLERSKKAGVYFSDIKVSHCPVCDQEITITSMGDHCSLCRQPIHEKSDSSKRLDYEIIQLKSEISELGMLLNQLESDKAIAIREEQNIIYELRSIEGRLIPVRNKLSAVLNPKVTLLDVEYGQLTEQIENVQRIKKFLDYKYKLSSEIDELKTQIHNIKSRYELSIAKVNLRTISDDLEDGINVYLQKLNNNTKKERWPKNNKVHVEIDETSRDITFSINDKDCEKYLGTTLLYYFLFAYNYSLLNLAGKDGYHYPGFCMIDLPADLSDKSEGPGYLVEPFMELSNSKNIPVQIIIAGRHFENLSDDPNVLEQNIEWV